MSCHHLAIVYLYSDIRHSQVIHHYHKHSLEMLHWLYSLFFPANASSVASAVVVAPISVTTITAITTKYLVFIYASRKADLVYLG
jgi:hypothetical protein